jgi:peptidoglycan hydrolase-like protein with peptidoglycan-binding domain
MAERRRLALVVSLVAAVLVAGATVVVAQHLRARPTSSSSSTMSGLSLVRVVRTDVADRQQVPGTLGYAGSMTVVGQLPGILTAAAAPGRVVGRGSVVASVDGSPVVLMLGSVPTWRTLALGVPDGVDVRELETNLRVLGYDPAHAMTVDTHFSAATAAAVRRWQAALHVARTGQVALGSVAFLPAQLRVTADLAGIGSVVGPGEPLVTGTSVDHQVSVALDAGRQGLVHVGDAVVVTLPDGTTTTDGIVSYVARVATTPADTGGGGQGGGQGGGSGVPTVQVTVRLLHQAVAGRLDQAPVQVSITDQLHRHVLAVPVTALLAGTDGYVVTRPDGSDVPVSVGLFDDLTQLVEVSGSGLAAGMEVQVPST